MEITQEIDTPFVCHLDAVEGCSLACSFCGIRSIRDNGVTETSGHGKNSSPYRYIEVETVEHVAKQAAALGWNPRWEFALHGEPTVHKDLPGLIAAVKRHHPKGYIVVTCNGSGLLTHAVEKIEALFNAGLNTLALDDYRHSGGWVTKIMKQVREGYEMDDILSSKSVPFDFYNYPEQPEGNLHHRHNGRKLVVVHDISDNTTGNHQLTNQGGSALATPKIDLHQRCAKPFREFNVRWDGNVAICCEDWQGQYKIGNVKETPLQDLWMHPRFEAARRRLYEGKRDFGPCRGCDVRSTRIGLLPDKKGKAEMPPSDDESAKYIQQALAGKVFSIKLGKEDV